MKDRVFNPYLPGGSTSPTVNLTPSAIGSMSTAAMTASTVR